MTQVDKSEKITINIGLIDLGQIDLLVNEGFYANRTDFIRTAIRRQLELQIRRRGPNRGTTNDHPGTQHFSRRDLDELRTAGRAVELRVLGLAAIDDDVTLSSRWRRSRRWKSSAFRAPEAVKAAWHPELCKRRRQRSSCAVDAPCP